MKNMSAILLSGLILLGSETFLINRNKNANFFQISDYKSVTEWTNNDIDVSIDAYSKLGFKSVIGYDGKSRDISLPKMITYGDSGVENFNSVAPTSDGGFISVGNKGEGSIVGVGDINKTSNGLIVKYDKYGNVEWDRVWGNENQAETFWGVDEVRDSSGVPTGYIAVGQQLDSDLNPNGGYTSRAVGVKFDTKGSVVWTTTLFGANEWDDSIFWNVICDSKGQLIMVGYRNESGDADYVIRIVQDEGSTCTYRDIIGNNDIPSVDEWKSERIDRIIEKPGDGYYAIGMENDWIKDGYKYGKMKGVLHKFDYNFNIVYKKTLEGKDVISNEYTGPGVDFDNILVASNGDIVVTGDTNVDGGQLTGNHRGDLDGLIIRYSPNGDIVWQKRIGGSGEEQIYGINEIDINGVKEFIITGSTKSSDGDFSNTTSYGNEDVFILNLDNNGDVIGNPTRFGGKEKDIGWWSCTLNDGRIIIAGTTSSILDEDGNVIPNSNSDAFISFVNTERIFNENFTVSENGIYAYTFKDLDNNTIQYPVIIQNIDKQKPNLPHIKLDKDTNKIIITDNGDPTNNKGGGASGVKSIYYRINNSDWNTYTNPIAIAKDTNTIEAKVLDNAGNYSNVKALENIDITPPTLILKNLNPEYTNSSVTIEARATDNISVNYIILPSGDKVYSSVCRFEVLANGVYSFASVDVSGNTTIESIEIKNIDKMKPNINIIKNPDVEWANRDVAVEIISND